MPDSRDAKFFTSQDVMVFRLKNIQERMTEENMNVLETAAMNTTTVRSADGHTNDLFDENERFLNKYHPDYIPGTINILLSKGDQAKANTEGGLKTNGNGIVLHPQPSDSPNDPLNWSWQTKVYQSLILLFITAFTAATSNDAGAVQDSMNEIYDISYASMNTGAGVLFVSIGLSTLILGPTAFLYGRKMTYLVCILMGLLGSVWFGVAKTTSDTIWSQLFVGASEGCAEATLQLSLSDMFFSHQLGWALTWYIMCTSIGTYLGPLIAGFIVEYTTFRWVGYLGAIISGGLLIVMIFTQYETYFDRSKYVDVDLHNIVSTRYEGHTEIDSSEKDKIATEVDSKSDSFGSLIGNNGIGEKRIPYWKKVALITPASNLSGYGIKQYCTRLFSMLRVFWFPPVILSGILWGLQDSFLTFYLTTADDQYYDPPFNYSDTGVALMNIPCLIGAIIGCFYAGVLSDYVVVWIAKRRDGIHEPEDYLYFLVAVFVACPIGLMVFAAGTDQLWSWPITYIIGLGFIGFSFGCSGDIAMSYLASCYPEMIIEGMIGVSIINNFISCIFTFTCSLWLDAMGNTNTYAILSAFQVLACFGAIPCIIYGRKIRLYTKKYYISFVEERDGLRKEVEVQ